jgi:hypothetical protein
VRLRTCILLELLVGASTLTGVGAGAVFGAVHLRDYVVLREGTALASTMRTYEADPRPAPRVEPMTPPSLDIDARTPELVPDGAVEPVAVEPAPPAPVNVFGIPDEELLATVRTGALTRVKANRGGTSLSLRLDFDGGGRAAFKPEQTFAHSNPRREIAAYRLDRLLGLGRVPPAEARRFPVDQLTAAFDPSMRGVLAQRVRDEAVARNGVLAGEVSWWVPVLSDAAIRGFRIDETDGIVTWRRLLRAGTRIPDRDLPMVQQISDMVVFDFLIDNLDRWSGSNTKASPDGKTLYFMDNTMSFSANGDGHEKSQQYLRRSQVFSRGLIAKVRALDEASLRRAMSVAEDSPLPMLLTSGEVRAFFGRRDALLTYLDGLIAEHGEDTVLAFP